MTRMTAAAISCTLLILRWLSFDVKQVVYSFPSQWTRTFTDQRRRRRGGTTAQRQISTTPSLTARTRSTTICFLGQDAHATDWTPPTTNLESDNHDRDGEHRINRLLGQMQQFWTSMIDPETHRFYAFCQPPTGTFLHAPHNNKNHAMRDLAAAWDTTKLLRQFLHNHALTNNDEGTVVSKYQTAVWTTLDAYHDQALGWMEEPKMRSEPIAIAHLGHLAMLLLVSTAVVEQQQAQQGDLCLHHSHQKYVHFVQRLSETILAQQRHDGSFAILPRESGNQKEDAIDICFFPGEAMVALMQVYCYYKYKQKASLCLHSNLHPVITEQTRQAILPAMERALTYYMTYYYQNRDNLDANYAIWQIQAFSQFGNVLKQENHPMDIAEAVVPSTAIAKKVQSYCTDLCWDILNSPTWKYSLTRGRAWYPNIETIEVACGLDALVDAGTYLGLLAERGNANREDHALRGAMETAIDFLEWSIAQVPADVPAGRGGLGYGGTCIRKQRLDVTGHAISALLKLHQV